MLSKKWIDGRVYEYKMNRFPENAELRNRWEGNKKTLSSMLAITRRMSHPSKQQYTTMKSMTEIFYGNKNWINVVHRPLPLRSRGREDKLFL